MSRRTYRAHMQRPGLVAFNVRYRETDLHIQAPRALEREVSEWVVERYAPYPGSELQLDKAERAHRVVRGGGAGVGHYSLSLFFRSARRAHAEPAMRSTDVGFRCARDAD